MIDAMDQGIGRIVKALETNGNLDNTLILYLHDNGGCAEAYGRNAPKRPPPDDIVPMGKDELQTTMIPARTRDGRAVRTGPGVMPGPADTYIAYGRNWANVSNTPFREYKSTNHEGGIATPLIAHWPKGIAARNELRHEPGHLIDIMATCIEISGAEYPARFADHDILPMEGRSLATGFTADRKEERTLLFEHYGRAAIRKGPWKLVRAGDTRPWELYAIKKDRTELNDLSKEQPEKVRELGELWEKEANRTYIYPKPGGKKKKG
jgi:arylsulfatase